MASQKKTCIVHNADADRCGCPDEVSQADVYRTEGVIPELPFIAKLSGEPPMEGPITVVWETRRVFGQFGPYWSFESKCIEARNAKETRKY